VTPADPAPASRLYLPGLDGWRALSILAVILHHFHASNIGNSWTDTSGLGVDMFFVISGYLITTLLISERERTSAINLRAFYVRRACRILPAASVYLVTVLLLHGASLIHTTSLCIAASFLFFRNFVTGDYVTAHYWSLSIEEQYYLLWPLFLAISATRRRAIIGCLILIAILFIWTSVDGRVHWVGRLFPGIPESVRTDHRVANLIWGSLAGLLTFSAQVRERLRPYCNPGTTLAAVVVLFLWGAHVAAARRIVLPAAIVVAILSTSLNGTSPATHLLENPVLRWFGRQSYSLYLWQQLFLNPADFEPTLLRPGERPLLAVACILACATASYFLVEKPLIRVGHRLSDRLMGQAA